jgi:hypothetical protein
MGVRLLVFLNIFTHKKEDCFNFLSFFLFETRCHCVAQVGLELGILSLPPKCWDYKPVPPCLPRLFQFEVINKTESHGRFSTGSRCWLLP